MFRWTDFSMYLCTFAWCHIDFLWQSGRSLFHKNLSFPLTRLTHYKRVYIKRYYLIPHTNTYRHILAHTGTYRHIPAHTSTYRHILTKFHILAHTSTYWLKKTKLHILAHTDAKTIKSANFYLIFGLDFSERFRILFLL